MHLLDTKYSLVQWELANPAEREATIADAVEFIESNVLPFFSRFDDPETLIACLEKQEVPAMNLLTAVEFAYCFAGKGKAQAVLNGFVNANPNLASAIAEAQVAALTGKLTEPGDYAQQVVYLRVLHGLA